MQKRESPETVDEAVERLERLERAQSFASLGEFAAGVARDLHALLLPIDQHALALSSETCGNRAAEARLQQILDTVSLARDLVQQVLTFSQGRASENRVLSLGALVRDALPLMRASIANTTLLRLAVDAQAPLVDASPIAMQRVLLNLVLNASRAIRQPHGVIEIGVAGMMAPDGCGAQFVRLTVADNGSGMDGATLVELRQHIAEPAAASHGAGLGLGLRIVQQIVRTHGGRLQLDSQPGNGATIRIDLPAASQQLAVRGRLA
jgi:two-component system cell cycle sensor histidine kinase/response regulator CckA